MSRFLKVNSLGYHIDGGFIADSDDRYEVCVSSTYDSSSEPEYKRKLLQLVMTEKELNELISCIQNIKYSKRLSDVQMAG